MSAFEKLLAGRTPMLTKIYAELVGYGANSDGYDMVAPSGVGGERCMELVMDSALCPSEEWRCCGGRCDRWWRRSRRRGRSGRA